MKKEGKMGKVYADVEVINAVDDDKSKSKEMPKEQVRKIQIKALVDTGATMLVLPPDSIKALGLRMTRVVQGRYADGKVRDRRIYGPATIRVFKRIMQAEVAEGAPNMPALLGQIPLEGLDLLVDAKNQRLILNPESQSQEMALIEM
jgi:predicted aspartyl protease